VRELQRDGVLQLSIGAHAGRVTLAKLVEHQRRLAEGSSEVIEERPAAQRSLAAGRYIVTAALDGGPSVSWPISIEPGVMCRISVVPPVAARLGDGEILIPGGPARIGGDALASESDELIIVDVAAFVLQRFPVTFGQWAQFLDDLRRRDELLATVHAPKLRVDAPGDPNLPVFGVSAESAEAYAKWLSERDGHAWRLPTEIEWEKAGRGTDGRIYPWGDQFDATFCKMRDSRLGAPTAEPIGAIEWDVSPYGVRDLAGGIADWCIPDPRRMAPREPREVVSRGGAWCDWATDCRLASRRRYLASEHSARVGVRLARDP
ncbi:MAG TPA: SUMF1/EgtB/PvdO family nonheme iron enzyme, partial [Kofleriaceae bacterium]